MVEINGIVYDNKIEFTNDKTIYQEFHPTVDGEENEDLDIKVVADVRVCEGEYHTKRIVLTLKQTGESVKVQAFIRDADDTTLDVISAETSEHLGVKVEWTPEFIRGRYTDLIIGFNAVIE